MFASYGAPKLRFCLNGRQGFGIRYWILALSVSETQNCGPVLLTFFTRLCLKNEIHMERACFLRNAALTVDGKELL